MARAVVIGGVAALTVGTVAAVSFVAGASRAVAQPEGMDHAAMMEEMARLSQPGEHHAFIRRSVGEWEAEAEFTMGPDGPTKGEGRMRAEAVLGGRFVRAEYEMDGFMGMEFRGIGYTGYDNARGEYVSTWMDSFGTGIMFMRGTRDGADGPITFEGASTTPMGEHEMRVETHMPDDDTIVDTFYDKMPDDTWVQSGRITYTRVRE